MKLVRNFIHGQYTSSASAMYRLNHACTGQPITEFYLSTQDQVEDAVSSAKQAQHQWSTEFSPADRAFVLQKTAAILAEKTMEIATLETRDTGRPIAETKVVDILSATDCLRYYAGLAPAIGGRTIDLPGQSWSYSRREPIGTTLGIGAWNYPLQSAAWKSAPALAFGNSMVFKPSEETPLSALALAEAYMEAGVPAGVFNVVLGAGETGNLLVNHPDISKVSFTGSAETGKKVCKVAADGLKKVTMELGGKSPLIIFDDTDIDNAVSAAMMANWYSSGQVCSNGTRVFVHEKIHDQFVARLVERTSKLRIGDPMDPEVEIGPMIHEKHMNNVMKFIQIGKDEGANLVYGGKRLGEEGYFLSPAIFTNCTDEMKIVQEEIFGMVMSILPFKSEDEVLQRANNTDYGLSAGVFTNDLRRGHRLSKELKAGIIWINNYNLAPVEVAWGGYKQSGLGKENGLEGVDSWTQIKSVYVEMQDKIDCPYK